MVDLSTYTLEQLRRDSQLVVYRGRRRGTFGHILVVTPPSERFEHQTIERLEHEYALRSELDSAWAAVPIALVRDKERTALVLEDPGGEPLERLLEHPLELTRFLQIAARLATALSSLHKRGIVHKDLKPGNVIVDDPSGQVWLTGFGTAISLAREPHVPEPAQTNAGTLAYIAPEQTGRMNRPIDFRSDLYSLGVILYQMLIGTLPFVASDPLELIHCHIARLPAPPEERRKELPAALSAIVLKLLAKAPEDRYQTAAGLEADLRRCLGLWEARGRIHPFILGTRDTSERLMIPAKLYGRSRENKALREAFERVVAQGTPEVVMVSGYSGVGKSSVANELRKAAAARRNLFISGKCDPHKRDIPYATLGDAFRVLISQILAEDNGNVRCWRDTIRDAVGQHGNLLLTLIPDLEQVLGEQLPAPELAPHEREGRLQAVFRAFIDVFTVKGQPLVLFLDDLQWVDTATLKLLEYVVTQSDVRNLLLIGAYRNNEVSAFHQLILALDSIRNAGTIVRDIVLSPLSEDDLNQLVADTVHQSCARTKPLARVVHEKTGGNPFFAIQFLMSLAEERLLDFDPGKGTWRWSMDQISGARITENVADLVVKKITRLPDNTLEAVKRLACLGIRANVASLAIVNGQSEEHTQADLFEAVHQGLLAHSGPIYEFVHDRVHEAAYSLISEEHRAEVHLQIGRSLSAVRHADVSAQPIFDVVNQLNRGITLISDPSERAKVAELNLTAARRARASAAYAAACSYLSVGINLLDRESWKARYELTFNLYLLAVECEFLCGQFDRAHTLISELLLRAASRTDQAAVYRLKIDLHIMQSEHADAVNSALECLRLFGINMSAHPSSQQVQAEYETIWRSLRERSIESLVELPLMTDPEMQAAMRVLSVLYSPAYFTDTNLFYLYICRMVNLSLKYGTAEASAHGYAYFGFILGPAFHRYTEGYRFGRLALEVVDRHGFSAYRAKVYLTVAWAAIWTQPIRTALGLIQASFRTAVETGDVTFACYCCDHIDTDLLALGVPLDEVWRESQKSLDFVTRAKSRDYVNRIVSQQQFIKCMRGQTAGLSTFNDTHLAEDEFETRLISSGTETVECWYWVLKLQARFISGDYGEALAASEKARPLLRVTIGCIQSIDYHYYTALVIAALFESAPAATQRIWREQLALHAEQLRDWAENCSESFRGKHLVVLGEIARIHKRDLDAMRIYEQAIQAAHHDGFPQNEAIANELAGRFYLHLGVKTAGQNYLRNARYCYSLWGAHAKVHQLDQLYPGLEREAPPLEAGTINPSIEQLELATIVRPLQAVSREIDFEKLIEIVMTNVLEHAGAERGLLFLVRRSELRIAAQALTHSNRVEVILAASMVLPPQFAETVVDHAVRTLESVIVEDGSAPGRFSDDAYVLTRRPRSILCLPLLMQGESIGVLYLENNLAPNVFTRDRLAVLELIASQAAISLKNAQLYADLQHENDERRKAEIELLQSTTALSHLQEELRQASRGAMMGELTASLAHELNQPLGGILINAQAVRRLLTAKKPDLAEIKAAIEEIISDDTRAVEIIRNVRSLFQRDDAQMGAVDLKQVLLDVGRILAADAMFRKVTLRSNLPASLPTIIGNRTQLLQALMNLVLNALDAVCEEGVETREVEIRASEPEPGQIHVAVSDSGKGIDHSIMPRLFDAFFTTKAKGMGMGLAITRSIVENHGGRLWATRNSSGGATLEFELPVKGEYESRN